MTETETKCKFKNVSKRPETAEEELEPRWLEASKVGGDLDVHLCTKHQRKLLCWVGPFGRFYTNHNTNLKDTGVDVDNLGFPIQHTYAGPVNIAEILDARERGESPEQFAKQITDLKSQLLSSYNERDRLRESVVAFKVDLAAAEQRGKEEGHEEAVKCLESERNFCFSAGLLRKKFGTKPEPPPRRDLDSVAYQVLLAKYGACKPAGRAASGGLRKTWESCDRGDWLMWLLSNLGADNDTARREVGTIPCYQKYSRVDAVAVAPEDVEAMQETANIVRRHFSADDVLDLIEKQKETE